MQVVLSILGIVLFICLVLVHEWGHFIVARRNGVKVEEFGLGFPPRAWGKKLKSGMLLSLNWLPLGGFVRLRGEHDADHQPGSFGAAPLSVKVKIMLAGVAANLIVGLVLLTILAVVGMPKIITEEWSGQDQFTVASDTKITHQEVRIGGVQPGSPAAAAGLERRDTILSLGGRSIKTSEQLQSTTSELAGKQTTLQYKHDGQIRTEQVRLRDKAEVEASLKTGEPKGYLGVEPVNLQLQRSTWSAPIVALGFTKQLTILTLKGIGHALGGLGSTIAGLVTNNDEARKKGQTQATAEVAGPVAIVSILWDSGSLGIYFLLTVIAIISLTLAIMNILPIPALDGGRLFVTLVSRGLHRPLSQNAEDLIHGLGMLVLLILFALITIVDVKRIFYS